MRKPADCDTCRMPIEATEGRTPRTHFDCLPMAIARAVAAGNSYRAKLYRQRLRARKLTQATPWNSGPMFPAEQACSYRAACPEKRHDNCAARFEAARERIREWLDEKEAEARRQKRAAWRHEVAA